MENRGFEMEGQPPVGRVNVDRARKISRADDDERFRNGFIATLIHLVKGYLGAGAFSTGNTVQEGGLLLGPILIVVLGYVCIFNNHVLVTCAEYIRAKKRLRTDPSFTETIVLCFENGPLAFRKWSTAVRLTMKSFIIFTQLGFCCVYVKFVASSTQTIMRSFNIDHDEKVYMAIIYIPVLLTCFIRTLKFLTPFSLLSNACLLIGVTLTLALSLTDLPPISSRPMVTPTWKTLPLLLGMVIYSFEGIALIVPLKNSMRQPKLFSTTFGVLNVGMFIYVGILLALGIVGFWRYGDDIKSPMTLNLPEGNVSSRIVQIGVAVGIMFSYALQFYVVLDLIWVEVQDAWGPFQSPVLLEMHLRTVLVTFTFLLAAVVPNLQTFIAFIGAVSSTALALFFPALSDIAIRTCPKEEGRLETKHQTLRFIMDGVTLLVSLFGFTFGGYYSVKGIIDAFFNNPDAQPTLAPTDI